MKTKSKIKALVVFDNHLGRTPDGRVWSARIYDYSFFARYLAVFDEVRVAIRIHNIVTNEGYPNLCSGEKVEFFAVEEFRGPKEYITKYLKIKQSAKQIFSGCQCAIFRIPSPVGYQLWKEYKKTRKPYAVEVVVDPWDVAAPGTLKTPLRPIIRWAWTHDLKRACLSANGVSYVTKYALQERYPSSARLYGENRTNFEEYFSSVNISVAFFAPPNHYDEKQKEFTIVHIANYINTYVKGHEELIRALSMIDAKQKNVRVVFVGEGSLIDEFSALAHELGVGDRVSFIGKLPTPQLVRAQLMKSDMFVFPSHAEGLPRALIEAMAVGLPCISTNVNGIPEILDAKWLVEPRDVVGLKEKIETMLSNPALMTEESKRNVVVATQYREDVLQKRRKIFYDKLRALCE